ncbi:D-amino acid oxidase [Friedmanniomyces endolithicus]|nr:D-amino acid oxidase [Friedmanniomyces endolithicus]
MAPKVVVLGAGVSGLTTALLLARSGDYDITIIAKHMPGDYDIEYASPWAGANYLPPNYQLASMVAQPSPQSASTQPCTSPGSHPNASSTASQSGAASSPTSPKQQTSTTPASAPIVVNCTGLASLRLGGVEDAAVYPARGQIVVVRNDPQVMASVSGTDDGSDEATYIMHRAAGGGCILGGCLQKDNWESQPDPNMAVRIMKRCVELCPKLVPEGKGIEALSIVRHSVGLRPMRKGGPRVERETIDGVPVVHNYGHGGYGYQTSYGAAQAAGRLVRKALGVGSKL